MKLSKTIKKLPKECVIISYDAEANHPGKPKVLPGSTMSLGAIYALWGENIAPFSYNEVLAFAPGPDILQTHGSHHSHAAGNLRLLGGPSCGPEMEHRHARR